MTTDTTPEAVERVIFETTAWHDCGWNRVIEIRKQAAATLRALAAERDALRADKDKLQGQLSYITDRLPDWIKAIGEWDEGGEAALDEMQDVLESTDTLVSEVSGLTGLQKAVAELADMHRNDLMDMLIDDMVTVDALDAAVDRLRGAVNEAFTRYQVTHIHADLRAALDASK